ncbi:Bcp Peroxiredoxin [Rhabdaerophilaceae bacterium]
MSELRLHHRLELARAYIARDYPRHEKAYRELIALLVANGVGSAALREGDMIPEFALPNAEGRLVRSIELLQNGPVILSFYRGEWCPYCQGELDVYAEFNETIIKAGGQPALLTAETGGQALRSKLTRSANFELLCDADLGVAMAFGLVFMVTPEVRAACTAVGDNFLDIYGGESGFLPIPATYVVGQDGRIVVAHVDPDFTKRLDPLDVLETISSLRG